MCRLPGPWTAVRRACFTPRSLSPPRAMLQGTACSAQARQSSPRNNMETAKEDDGRFLFLAFFAPELHEPHRTQTRALLDSRHSYIVVVSWNYAILYDRICNRTTCEYGTLHIVWKSSRGLSARARGHVRHDATCSRTRASPSVHLLLPQDPFLIYTHRKRVISWCSELVKVLLYNPRLGL